MTMDAFGDLREWGDVLAALERLKRERQLDDQQVGLARLLRYRQNWRLREAALDAATEIRQASDVLIAEVLNTVVSPDNDIRLRVIAAGVLPGLVARRQGPADSNFSLAQVRRTLGDMLPMLNPPVLGEAVADAYARLKS